MGPMRPFELRGDGILLAAPTYGDLNRLIEICQDPENQRWTSMPVPYRPADAEAFLVRVAEGWAGGADLTWAVRRPEDRRLLGMIDLRVADSQAEVGFTLASDARGRGVMSRAVRLVAGYAFAAEGLGLTHLHWWAHVGNWASRRVAWAAGFRHEGLVRGAKTQRGEARDCWVATLAAGEPTRPATRWLDVPRLAGAHVTLRPFADSDLASITEACGDPLTQHWLSRLPSPYTDEHARRFVHDGREEAAAGSGVHWAAIVDDDGPAVGSFSLSGLRTHDGGAEVGYWVHPAARGRGVASEAVRLMASHAFAAAEVGGLGLRRLVARIADGNETSRKAAERAGFRRAGAERAGGRIAGGTVVDLHLYDLLRDDLASPSR